MDNQIKHLEMVQHIIDRMAGNSFMLKGWTVALMTGIFVLADKDSNELFFLCAYIPIFVFWGLDAYYLRQERLYRKLYDHVRSLKPQKIDFSMNTAVPKLHGKKTRYSSCLFSVTELGFYLPLAVLYSILAITAFAGWLSE